jgi:hypothetical protein
MSVAFTSPKPSHNNTIAMSDVNRICWWRVWLLPHWCQVIYTPVFIYSNGCAAFASSVPYSVQSMKKDDFSPLSVPSHMYVGLHLLKQICRLCLIGAKRCLIKETKMTFTSSVPSHVHFSLHLLKQIYRLRLVGAQRCSISLWGDVSVG